MDPNSLDIYPPQAPFVNLITLFDLDPSELLQPLAPASGLLDGHHSIQGNLTGMGHQMDSPNLLEWAHVGLHNTKNLSITWA